VNSYKEEGNIKTTLVQGSVQITFMNGTALLKPGQQALADADKGLHVKKVDVTKETAWKNGLFQFTDADLKKIMREFGRWYNVDVVYEGDVEPRNFEGAIPRSLDLQDALDVLKGNNVHFKLEGRKLIVLP
jgi:ferric-dicitrate binding protein FerR (iron transport regulator)